MRPRWLAGLLLLASARGDARTCAPLPLSEQFRWFHVPKTGSSFSVTLWSWLCPTSLPAGFGTTVGELPRLSSLPSLEPGISTG